MPPRMSSKLFPAGISLGTALAGELIAADQVERRQGAVAEIADRRFVDVELPPRAGDIGAAIERRLDGLLPVDRHSLDARLVRRVDLRVPQRIGHTAHDELLQRQLVGALRLDRLRQRLAARRRFGPRLHDVDRGHRADLDPEQVVLDEPLGQRQRPPLHVHGGARMDEVPVGQADVGQGVDDGLLEVDVGDVPVDARDDELRATGIGAEPAQQRLRVLQGHVCAEARVEGREDVGRLLSRGVPGDVVPAAAPPDLLSDPEVVGAPVGDDGPAAEPAAVEHGAVGSGSLVEVEAGRGEGQERRAGGGDLHVLHERVNALDGDVEVLLESALDGVVERELEAAGRLPGPARDSGDSRAPVVSRPWASDARAAAAIGAPPMVSRPGAPVARAAAIIRTAISGAQAKARTRVRKIALWSGSPTRPESWLSLISGCLRSQLTPLLARAFPTGAGDGSRSCSRLFQLRIPPRCVRRP